MKLLTKTSIYYLLFAIPVLVVAGFASYLFMQNQTTDSVDESLFRQLEITKQYIAKNKKVPNFESIADMQIDIKERNDFIDNVVSITDTNHYDAVEEEIVPYRMLKNNFVVNNQSYQIRIEKSTIKSDELFEGLFNGLLVVYASLFLCFILVNWYISKKIWKPFYSSVEQLKKFSVISSVKIKFENSSIKEFVELNSSLSEMTEKIFNDYRNQKEFTENASHEMQTPLAVIQSKIELLIQSKSLGEEEMNLIQSILDSSNKLSQLNKTLLLLAKIENNQFEETVELNLKDTVQKVLKNFEDKISIKNIVVEKRLSNDIQIMINPVLAEVMLSNLLQNAVRHNIQNGKIIIETKPNEIIISNTGNPLSVKSDDLFERFKKGNSSVDSIGLGLAIVKSIADAYHLKVLYSFEKELHVFSIQFSEHIFSKIKTES